MKVGRLAGTGGLQIDDVPVPRPGAGEVVVRMAACGVCGTDLEKLRGNYQTKGILGHEPVGIVDSTGPDVEGIAVGSRVFVHHHVPCYNCPVCAKGDYTFCPTYSQTNIDPGGFSELFRVPKDNVSRGAVLPLDPVVSWKVGALIEPAGCILTALRRSGFRPGDTVFVVGLGPVGLLYGRIAQAAGARWVGGAEIASFRRAAAERTQIRTFDPREPQSVLTGIHEATGGIGADLVVVATGASSAVRLAEQLPRRGGTLNLFGLPEPGTHLGIDLQKLYLSGVRVVPTYATTEPDLREIHRMIAERKVRFDDLVSHDLSLDRIQDAFALAARPEESLKVVVTGPAWG